MRRASARSSILSTAWMHSRPGAAGDEPPAARCRNTSQDSLARGPISRWRRWARCVFRSGPISARPRSRFVGGHATRVVIADQVGLGKTLSAALVLAELSARGLCQRALVLVPAGLRDQCSHDVVARTRRLAGTRKVGHAGTLDPMATGLLVLGVNSSTRLLTYLVGLDKEYLATIRLGSSTTTDDAEGEPIGSASPDAVAAITDAGMHEQLAQLTGAIQQVPSSVSAIKVDGRRAYARVRAGEEFELPARPVTVFAFEALDQRRAPDHLDLDVRVACSSGTYMRALARDLGAALGVGGHLVALRRTRIGPFRVTDAAALDDLDVAAAAAGPRRRRHGHCSRACRSAPQQVIDLVHGKKISVSDLGSADPGPSPPSPRTAGWSVWSPCSAASPSRSRTSRPTRCCRDRVVRLPAGGRRGAGRHFLPGHGADREAPERLHARLASRGGSSPPGAAGRLGSRAVRREPGRAAASSSSTPTSSRPCYWCPPPDSGR